MQLSKTILTLTIATLAATLVQAQPHRGGGPGGPPDFTVLKTYLNLTDAQVSSLQDLNKSQHQATQAIATDLRSKHQALNNAVRSGSTDAGTLNSLAQAVKAGEAQMASIRQSYQAQAVGLLTPDQKTKLAAITAAAALMPHVHEASMLNLISPPAGGRGFGGPGGPPPPAPQDQ